VDDAEWLGGTEISGSAVRSRDPRSWPSTIAESGVVQQNSMEMATATMTRAASSSQVVWSS
jgi:hypothetical protein